MEYEIRYFNDAVFDAIKDLPVTLAARYLVLARRIEGSHEGAKK